MARPIEGFLPMLQQLRTESRHPSIGRPVMATWMRSPSSLQKGGPLLKVQGKLCRQGDSPTHPPTIYPQNLFGSFLADFLEENL